MRWTSGTPSVGDAEDLLDGLRLVEDAEHEEGDVGAGDEDAAPQVAPVGDPVGTGQWLVGESWRADHRPGQAAVAQYVLHQREVGVVLAQRRLDQRVEHVTHDEPVTRVVFRWVGAPG